LTSLSLDQRKLRKTPPILSMTLPLIRLALAHPRRLSRLRLPTLRLLQSSILDAPLTILLARNWMNQLDQTRKQADPLQRIALLLEQLTVLHDPHAILETPTAKNQTMSATTVVQVVAMLLFAAQPQTLLRHWKKRRRRMRELSVPTGSVTAADKRVQAESMPLTIGFQVSSL